MYVMELHFVVLQFIIHTGRWSWVILMSSTRLQSRRHYTTHSLRYTIKLPLRRGHVSHKRFRNNQANWGTAYPEKELIHVSGIWTLGPAVMVCDMTRTFQYRKGVPPAQARQLKSGMEKKMLCGCAPAHPGTLHPSSLETASHHFHSRTANIRA
jgi:hypothetical protein